MNSFIVTYDLRKPNSDDRAEDYEKLYKKLESFYSFARITESSWIVQGDFTAVSIRDEIKSILKDDDRLFVAVLTDESAWSNSIDSIQRVKDTLSSFKKVSMY